ncbi:MAG TPA: ankyrin repeat domain-containing protein [Pyrinomonadaceae bacterium]
MSKNSLLEKIDVKAPCSENWDEMCGTDEVRFCSHCALEVNNLSALTRKQAAKLVRESNGRICVRYVKNPQTNQPVFREKLYQISRRAGVAAGVLGASLSLSSITYAQGEAKLPEIIGNAATVKKAIALDENKIESAAAKISGTITDPNGAVIPNASVTLINSETKETRSATANEEGFYEFVSVAAGNYSIRAEANGGFTPFIVESVAVAEGKNLKRDIEMGIGGQFVTVGEMVAIEYASPLHRAVSNDEIDEVKSLIARGESVNAKDENYGNITPLFLTVENGNTEIAELLLDFGAKANARDAERQTPLMRLDADASPEVARALIKHGAKVNLTDKEGNTALMWAAREAKAEILQILLANGANVNARNKEGQTALMNAAEENNSEAVRALIFGGADVNLKNKDGETAWDLTDDDEIEKLLESHGAKTEDN